MGPPPCTGWLRDNRALKAVSIGTGLTPPEESPGIDPTLDLAERQWIQLALQEARQAGQDVPVGCVIVRDGMVVGRGFNRREATSDPTAHAEIIALREAAQQAGTWRLNGCTVYSTLEPCPMCAEAMIQARVSRLVFGAYDSASGAAGSVFNLFIAGRIYPIPEVIGGLCEEECRTLLIEFFQSKSSR